MGCAPSSGSATGEEGLQRRSHLLGRFPRREMADSGQGHDLDIVADLADALELERQ